MNIFLWVLQCVLAAMFGLGGVMKATQPKEKLVKSLPWVADFSANTVKLIGVAELLAGLGLVLPAATGIATVLTPLAAVGLIIVMIGAIMTHLRRSESQAIVLNVVLLLLAAVVAWGRFGPYSF